MTAQDRNERHRLLRGKEEKEQKDVPGLLSLTKGRCSPTKGARHHKSSRRQKRWRAEDHQPWHHSMPVCIVLTLLMERDLDRRRFGLEPAEEGLREPPASMPGTSGRIRSRTCSQ